jgi:DNA-binding transcriptional ArsR family regulator
LVRLSHTVEGVARSDVLDRVFHAMSDPGRRRMLERLADGPASVSDLGSPLQMSLAAVVQHVQVLEASGLVQSRKTGRVRMCEMNVDTLGVAEQWLISRRSAWERRLDRLSEVLDEQAARGTPSPTRKRGRIP